MDRPSGLGVGEESCRISCMSRKVIGRFAVSCASAPDDASRTLVSTSDVAERRAAERIRTSVTRVDRAACLRGARREKLLNLILRPYPTVDTIWPTSSPAPLFLSSGLRFWHWA